MGHINNFSFSSFHIKSQIFPKEDKLPIFLFSHPKFLEPYTSLVLYYFVMSLPVRKEFTALEIFVRPRVADGGICYAYPCSKHCLTS